jgi:succinate-semialdehyde dehydrogenase/glutarate-semialdehyde dehydrogenase
MSTTSTRPVFATTNPASLEPGETVQGHNPEDAARIVGLAADAQRGWRRTGFDERARAMKKAAGVLREGRERFAAIMTAEMGKPVSDGRAEVDKCATACEHFADHAAGYLAREPVAIDGAKAFVTCNPLGVVLAVMPWNFPFWQVFRFAAPALMAGNGGVLKHASNVPGCAIAIEAVFREAGLSRAPVQDGAGSERGRRGAHPRRPHRGCHADRKRRCRAERRRSRRRGPQEMRARARRV